MGTRERDRQFEAELRRFRPRAPQAPLLRRGTGFQRWREAAALAAVLLLFAALTWTALRLPRPVDPAPQAGAATAGTQVSLGRLNRLLREDPARADAELLRVAPRLLPDVERPGSTLGVLAAE